MWRALGLATRRRRPRPVSTSCSPAGRRALYSTVDGQIYHDETPSPARISKHVVDAGAWRPRSSTSEFGWAVGSPVARWTTPPSTSADVLSQATATQTASEFDTPIDVAADRTARVSAGGDLVPGPGAGDVRAAARARSTPLAPNPLADVDHRGPGPLATDTPTAGRRRPSSRTATWSSRRPSPMDRSFWYLAFASFLDAPTAFAASESDRRELAHGRRACRDHVRLRDLLRRRPDPDLDAANGAANCGSANVPAEFTAAFSVAADGDLQLVVVRSRRRSSSARIGIGAARELIGWRSAEIATINGVVANGGGEAEHRRCPRPPRGVRRRSRSSRPSPVGDTPEQAADAVTAAVAPIVTPPAPPAVEPAG